MYELNLANILCDVKGRKFRLVSKTTPKNVNCSTLSNYFSPIIITYIALFVFVIEDYISTLFQKDLNFNSSDDGADIVEELSWAKK